VVPGTSDDQVAAAVAEQVVPAGAAVDPVVARSTDDPLSTVDLIAAPTAAEQVVASEAVDGVVAGAGEDDIDCLVPTKSSSPSPPRTVGDCPSTSRMTARSRS
jgi:hypothetical protein